MSFNSRSLPAPTVAESARMDRIKSESCCTVCLSPWVDLHHILSPGGLRISHAATVGLCRSCHDKVKTRSFKRDYPNQWLLDLQNQRLGMVFTPMPTRRARRGSTDSPKREPKPRPVAKRGGQCIGGSKTYPRAVQRG